MLVHLSIKNFAVVRELDIKLHTGLTAITGETGAGKSIAIDALSLCLGERADANSVRQGAAKAEIVAHFDVTALPHAQAWLDEHELIEDDDSNTCFIRRVISKEGRSKAFINGSPVSLQQLKSIGVFLLAIHGQNTHLQLLKEDYQRTVIDEFAHHPKKLDRVSTSFRLWKAKHSELESLRAAEQQREDRRQLLDYQVKELDDFALFEGEFEQLEAEHKRLSNGQSLLEQAQTSFFYLYESDEGNALSTIQQSIDRLAELQQHDPALDPIVNLLNEASIQVEEASNELRSYCDSLEIDPLRLQQVESRYAQAMELARKHGVMPEELPKLHQELAEEFSGLIGDQERLVELAESVVEAQADYTKASEQLSVSRQNAAGKLSKVIQQQIKTMNMPHAQVDIQVHYKAENKPSVLGQDSIQFLVSTNPGQAADKLDKVVSGGELSRIGLAIQVTAAGEHMPTLIFDEVDTGISGPTASIVGQLLRQLGSNNQVMCVTHLPQVAAQAHNQLFVTKTTDGNTTETHMLSLTHQEREHELARLLAGDEITELSLANARELLAKQS